MAVTIQKKSHPVSMFERALAVVAPTYALSRAVSRSKLTFFGYDAADPGIRRGSSGGMGKNAGSETAQMSQDRLKLMWDARDLERNMPIIRCVLDRTSQYVCGQIRYQAATLDPEADREYEAYWNHWCENVADATGRHNFRMLVELAFRSMLRDGDFGFALVRNGPDLQLQCIEADRIGDPSKVSMMNDQFYVQGIRVDAAGRPVAYDVYQRERGSNRYIPDAEIPAEQFFFLSKPLRTDEYRSVSWLAPVLAQARDLYEMFAFERGAAKWAASIAGVITTPNPNLMGGSGSAGIWDGVNLTPDGKPAEEVLGNRLLRLRPSENVTPFNTGNRPSGAFQAYIEMAIRDISMGLNVPYGFFNMAQFGGATVRLEAMQLDRTFNRYQEILVSKVLNKVKREVLQNAIALGQVRSTEFWDLGRWQFGSRLTADTGYDTDANLQLLGYGLKSASSIAGEQGLDMEEVTAEIIKESMFVRDNAQMAGLPIELIAPARFPDATNQLAAVVAAATPQEAPSAGDIGEGGMKTVLEILQNVAGGMLPRDEAVELLVASYGFTPEAAQKIVPKLMKTAVSANQPAPPAAGGGKKLDGRKLFRGGKTNGK